VIEVKPIKSILIMFVVQLFCNTITMFSIHTFLLFVHVLCLNMPPLCLVIDSCMFEPINILTWFKCIAHQLQNWHLINW